MFYEVFIPSTEDEGFDVTMTVEADNWMTALKSGLERTGEGAEAIRNVMCDIKEDNTIHVTDAGTRRVFVLREMADDATDGESQVAPPDPAKDEAKDGEESDVAPTQQMEALPKHEPDRPKSAPKLESKFQDEDYKSREATQPRHRGTAPPPESARPPATGEPLESRDTTKFQRDTSPRRTDPPPEQVRPPTGKQEPTKRPSQEQRPGLDASVASPDAASPEPAATKLDEISDPLASEPTGGLGEEPSWTSEDGRMRIGSSTFEALKKDEPEAKVVRETRAPSGQREAIDIGRATESVSQNTLEEVFLEIQQIHEREMAMEDVINFVMDLAMEKVSAEAGSIMFVDVNGRELYFATARGPKAHQVMDFRVPMGKGIVGFCAREGVSLAISDAENDPRFYKEISEALGYETKNVACAPVQFEGRVYGAIELMNKSSAFSNTEVNVLTYVGRQLAKFVHDLIMAREKLE